MKELFTKLSQVLGFSKENHMVNKFDSPGNNGIEFDFDAMDQVDAVESKEGSFDFDQKEVMREKGKNFMAKKLSEYKARGILNESEQNPDSYVRQLNKFESRYKQELNSLLNIDGENKSEQLFSVYNRLQRNYERDLFFHDLEDVLETYKSGNEDEASQQMNTLLSRSDKYFLTVGGAARDFWLAEDEDKEAAKEKLTLERGRFDINIG